MKLSVTVRHVVEFDDEWLFAAEEEGFDPEDPEELLEWMEQFKSLSDFETGRTIEVLA